ncbi:hypothetical protein SEA_GARDENSTATE_36 [Microbacterium phage GardenState]|uniref:Uncharacterized protein n=2 Tax=Gardenstatevirus TaxID=3425012 RepID=A0A4Y6E719_9CAUD|nr:hypothetical protein SEA_IAMGROOT_36 [Microbacterium phage IAmGroot]QOI66948.1 hypothetical protein SEA_GARDENSTATE_36 [Microbacterium phage GardenState]
MNGTDRTEPDDLAPGVYRDRDGDLWAVDRTGKAQVLTDQLGFEHDLGDLVIPPSQYGLGLPADQAHAAYSLRLLFPF